jgi:prepilin peptidase CpaA
MDASTMRTLAAHDGPTAWIMGLRLVFVALLAWAALSDLRARRIPNLACTLLLVFGIVAALATSVDLRAAVASVAIGLALWGPMHLLGFLGAGDVKLFAAAAAWLAPVATLRAAALAAVLGGALGLLWLAYARGPRVALARLGDARRHPQRLREPQLGSGGRDARVPYGVAMVAALLFEAAQQWRLG